jgi:hypothetical protein
MDIEDAAANATNNVAIANAAARRRVVSPGTGRLLPSTASAIIWRLFQVCMYVSFIS